MLATWCWRLEETWGLRHIRWTDQLWPGEEKPFINVVDLDTDSPALEQGHDRKHDTAQGSVIGWRWGGIYVKRWWLVRPNRSTMPNTPTIWYYIRKVHIGSFRNGILYWNKILWSLTICCAQANALKSSIWWNLFPKYICNGW